jgi:hypothetical protein
MAARILLVLLFSLRLSAQTDADSFLVEGKDFKGYIMPLDAKAQVLKISFENQFLPSKKDIDSAENILKDSLVKMCLYPRNYYDSVDCRAIQQSLPEYFRQYAAYTDKETGHRMVYIRLISKNAQARVDFMKKTWMNKWCDGGPIYFKAKIDLDSGKCIYFDDNGFG